MTEESLLPQLGRTWWLVALRGVAAVAIRLRQEIEGAWLLGLSGVLSVIFGVLMILNPSAGALAVLWVIATYSIVFGVLLIALGIRLRKLGQRSDLHFA
jgi:uncharacterized membrane protein HdeD (DUF308 family)